MLLDQGTTITSYPSLEPNKVGTYDDTVLKLLDAFMIEANKYKVKVCIAILFDFLYIDLTCQSSSLACIALML